MVAGADHLFSELKNLSRSRDGSGLQEHSVLRYATSRKVAWEQEKRIEILAYGEPKLSSVVEWWKQLFGESEGKESKGLFPVGLSCTTDLHSLGQYVQEGCRNLVETFLLIDSDNSKSTLQVPAVADKADGLSYLEGCPISEINDAAMLATQIAHSDGDVPCLELNLAKLDEHHLGYLFAFYETVCAVSSSLLGVNAFDQPGVEAYKQNLFGLMNKPGFEDVAAALKSRLQ